MPRGAKGKTKTRAVAPSSNLYGSNEILLAEGFSSFNSVLPVPQAHPLKTPLQSLDNKGQPSNPTNNGNNNATTWSSGFSMGQLFIDASPATKRRGNSWLAEAYVIPSKRNPVLRHHKRSHAQVEQQVLHKDAEGDGISGQDRGVVAEAAAAGHRYVVREAFIDLLRDLPDEVRNAALIGMEVPGQEGSTQLAPTRELDLFRRRRACTGSSASPVPQSMDPHRTQSVSSAPVDITHETTCTKRARSMEMSPHPRKGVALRSIDVNKPIAANGGLKKGTLDGLSPPPSNQLPSSQAKYSCQPNPNVMARIIRSATPADHVDLRS